MSLRKVIYLWFVVHSKSNSKESKTARQATVLMCSFMWMFRSGEEFCRSGVWLAGSSMDKIQFSFLLFPSSSIYTIVIAYKKLWDMLSTLWKIETNNAVPALKRTEWTVGHPGLPLRDCFLPEFAFNFSKHYPFGLMLLYPSESVISLNYLCLKTYPFIQMWLRKMGYFVTAEKLWGMYMHFSWQHSFLCFGS